MPVLGSFPKEPEKPTVQAVYQQLLEAGHDQKSAAKEAQARTGVSLVSGRVITKKVEFNSTGKAGYSGQYPSTITGQFKHTKPAAWPA